MLFHQANLTCKNQDCSKPIWLPLSIPLDRFEHQLKWPKDDWKRNFLCLSCKQVNLYKAQDVRWEPVDRLESQQDEKVVASIAIGCDPPRCEALVKVFAVIDSGRSKIEAIEQLKGEWLFVGAYCPHYHPVIRAPGSSKYTPTFSDAGWLDDD